MNFSTFSWAGRRRNVVAMGTKSPQNVLSVKTQEFPEMKRASQGHFRCLNSLCMGTGRIIKWLKDQEPQNLTRVSLLSRMCAWVSPDSSTASADWWACLLLTVSAKGHGSGYCFSLDKCERALLFTLDLVFPNFLYLKWVLLIILSFKLRYMIAFGLSVSMAMARYSNTMLWMQ